MCYRPEILENVQIPALYFLAKLTSLRIEALWSYNFDPEESLSNEISDSKEFSLPYHGESSVDKGTCKKFLFCSGKLLHFPNTRVSWSWHESSLCWLLKMPFVLGGLTWKEIDE